MPALGPISPSWLLGRALSRALNRMTSPGLDARSCGPSWAERWGARPRRNLLAGGVIATVDSMMEWA
jgi:hypothetical protein